MAISLLNPDQDITSIVFIDGSLPDLRAILSGLDPSATAIVLDPAQDGIQQMTDALAGVGGLSAIHVISHGSRGRVNLGTAWLTQDTLAQYQNQLATIGRALSDTGDLLLYGCNVAQGDVGQAFISALASATGADVAASSDLTGAAFLSGNWQLEANTGTIEATMLHADIAGVLATITGTAANDTITGTAGNDTIYGLDGNDTLDGGLGDDYLDGGFGFDIINGGAGVDTTSYAFYSGPINANLLTGIVQFPGNSTLTDTLISIENLIGTAGNDTITGNDVDNVLTGGNGNDTLDGGLGNDTVVLAGNWVDYVFSQPNLTQIRIARVNGTETDIMSAVETVKFADGTTANVINGTLQYTRPDDYLNTTNTTGAIAVGGAATGNIETAGDTDWFRITLTAGHTYQFDLEGSATGQGTLADPFLRLRDSAGVSVPNAFSDDGGVGYNSRFSFAITTTGTYFLAAGSNTTSGTGTYKMGVADVTPATLNHAPIVASPMPDLNWLEGSSLHYTVPAGTFSDPDGNALSYSASLSTGSALPSWLTFNASTHDFIGTAPSNSIDYTIRVTATDTGGLSTYDDVVFFTLGTTNHAPIVASPMPDLNWLEGSSLHYTVPAGTFSDPDGNALSYSASLSTGSALPSWLSFNASTHDFIGTAPSNSIDYTVRVTATDTSGLSAYDDVVFFTPVVDDYAANTSTTGRVSVGGSSTGRVETNGDQDWFAINLTAGQTYEFRLNSASSGGLSDPYLNLYNSSGTLLNSNDDGGGNQNSLITFTPTASGAYYLGARAYSNGTGDYLVSATASSISSDDYAANASTSGQVSVGGSSTGRVETNGDQDWFAINLTAGQTYEFRLNSASSGGLSDPYLSLYNSSGSLLNFNDDGGGNLNSLITFTAPTGGAYYLGARAFSTGTGDYGVSATALSMMTDDYAANTSTTGLVSVGGSATGRVETNGDQDWFAINLTAGQTYEFRLNSASSGGLSDPYLNLYNSSGSLLNSNDDGGGNLNSLITFTASTNGTYYLGARAFLTGTGNYGVSATVVGTSLPPASPFHIDINYSGDPAYSSVFDTAAARWEQVITQDLPDVTSLWYGLTDGFLHIDDLLIDASVRSIDGAGNNGRNILGQAAPDAYRSGSSLPYHGFMQFDSWDMQAMSTNGTLLGVIEHEMGHVLGLGTLWDTLHLKNGNYNYIGTNALAQYRILAGDSSLTSVPLERYGGTGSAGSHWIENGAQGFDTELMSSMSENMPLIAVPIGELMPLSVITIGALADLGYAVNYAVANSYTLPVLSTVTSSIPQNSNSSSANSVVAAYSVAAFDTAFSGVRQVHYEDKPLIVDPQRAPIVLNGPITDFTQSSVFFFELTTGNDYLVRLQGSFVKDNASDAKNIKGTIDNITFYQHGEIVDFFDYTGSPLDISALQNWQRYPLDGNNYFESRSPSPQDDICIGLGGDDVFSLGAGNDRIDGGSGTDTLDGGTGLDTATFSGNRSNFTVTASGTGFIVIDNAGANGTDALTNIERLSFADKKVAIDLGGNAGTTAKILGAVFGAASVQNTEYVGIGLSYLDSGMSYQDLMLLALNARLGTGFSNADEVSLLYQNLAGVLPSTADLNYWTGTLASGQFTQTSLAVMAADHSLNTANINLVGLAQTGIEFVEFV